MDKTEQNNLSKNRRQFKREKYERMGIGIFYPPPSDNKTEDSSNSDMKVHYIDLIDKSDQGLCLRTAFDIDINTPYVLQVFNPHEKAWYSYHCTGKWKNKDSTDLDCFRLGCESSLIDENTICLSKEKESNIPSPGDFMFLRSTRFSRSMGRVGLTQLLNSLEMRQVKAGESIIEQGEKGDACFIIQKGACIITITRKGEKHQIASIKEGGIVGEMALLTGEVRSAGVEAKTDMILWRLGRDEFEALCKEFPGVRNFLTELITERFSSREKTAKRDIGKYTITDIIGKGGYAIVYKGLHRDLNMAVAIKMMKHDMAMDDAFIKKFRDEARLIAEFNHRNIVNVYDYEKQFRTIFIIMEFLDGTPLEDILLNCFKLPYATAVNYLIQICNGLRYAHNRGIVHQDIKPANVLIMKNDQIKILDFGLACSIATKNIDFLGSPFYMSPEQIEMEAIDERSDIYSIGIMTYEMITGQRPYPEDDLLKLEDLHVEQDIPDPWEIDPDIPEELRNFILKACHRDLDRRYRNIDEVFEQILPLKKKFCLNDHLSSEEKIKMTTLHLFSKDEHQVELNHLLEDFNAKAQKLGVTLKSSNFKDIDIR